jgi:hypothetical protein
MPNSNKKIYIFCPPHIQSGGPEAIYQLRYYMEMVGFDAYLVYFKAKKDIPLMPERYKIYNPRFKKEDEIDDNTNNILIAAETYSNQLNGFIHIQKCIWWLSVNYAAYVPHSTIRIIKNLIKDTLKLRKKPEKRFDYSLKDCKHICGSKYAYEFLRKRGLKNIHYCVEPISKQFLEYKDWKSYKRNNVILYNPAKPSELMLKLLERKNFEFLPLQGYTPAELAEYYQQAKLYVDFGIFAGPERMPKEAVYFGCTILVGKRNAAKNNWDVAIPDKYKIARMEDIEFVENRIRFMLDNYDRNSNDFKPFRDKIELLEVNFIKQLKESFS